MEEKWKKNRFDYSLLRRNKVYVLNRAFFCFYELNWTGCKKKMFFLLNDLLMVESVFVRNVSTRHPVDCGDNDGYKLTIQLVFCVIEHDTKEMIQMCVDAYSSRHSTIKKKNRQKHTFHSWFFTFQNLFASWFCVSAIYLRNFGWILLQITSRPAPQKLIFIRLTAHEHDACNLFLCWVDVLFKCMRVEAAPFKFIVRYCPQQNGKKKVKKEKKKKNNEIRNIRMKVIRIKTNTNEKIFSDRNGYGHWT